MKGETQASGVVGREPELAALADFLDQVRTEPATLRLEGDAGAGKTTLWQAGLELARERGYVVLTSSPVEAERELSYAGLGDLLDPVASRLGRLPGPQRDALRVALLIAEAEGPPPDQRAVSLAVLALLRELSRESPLLVAVDDVQWIDPPTARVLNFAVRRLEAEPIGVLTALRLGDAPDRLTLPALNRLEVPPLSLRTLGRLLHERTGVRLQRSLLAEVHRASGGNAFFALELAAALLESGTRFEPGQPLPVPEDLGRLLRGRLERFAADTRRALFVVAAAAHPTRALVQDATGTNVDAADEILVLEGDRLRFTHPLLASVVYDLTPPAEGRALHRRLAELVDDPEERARHLALAAEGRDESVAAALEEAAVRARSRGAPDAAAELAEHAVELTPDGGGPAALRRRLLAAERHFEAGDAARARSLLEEALDVAPSGPPRARVLSLLGNVLGDVESITAALDCWREALAQAGDDLALQARIHQDLGFFEWLSGSMAAGERHTRAALGLAEQLGEPRSLALALTRMAGIRFFRGRGLDDTLFERAMALESEIDVLLLDERPSTSYAGLLVGAGRLEEARDRAERLLALADEQGEVARTVPLLTVCAVEFAEGAWPAAIRLADEGIARAEEAGREGLTPAFLAMKARAAALLGDVTTAEQDARDALAGAEAGGHLLRRIQCLGLLGVIELSGGDDRAAERYFAPAFELAGTTGIEEPSYFFWWPDALEVLVALGRLDEAEERLEPIELKARELDRVWARAAGARCRGLVMAARGVRDDSVSAFEEALRQHDRLGQTFEEARTLLAYGTAERRFQQRRRARELLVRALAEFEQLGARQWVARARAELDVVGGRAAMPGRLTATEQRIAELVASGRSNQQVADALFLSPKTVEWNLSKVYKKLRVSSRTELAAKLARRQARTG